VSAPRPTDIAYGMPQDRLARLAARQAFVDLKHDFMVAVAGLPGARGEVLRHLVRKAEDADTLWRARHALFRELQGNDPDSCSVRHSLTTGLDSLFLDSMAPVANHAAPMPQQPSIQAPR
jgi:hypothetical protein